MDATNMGTPGSGVAQPILSTTTSTNSTTPPIDDNSRPLAYSQVTRSTNNTQSFPKKEQAIVLNFIENLKLSDYVISIGDIVGAKNILFASRISNNRVCIYLSQIKYVDEIVQHHNKIEISGNEVNIRRLITPSKRIIISNVCPSIPHSILEQLFTNMGLKLVSPVTFLRANIQSNQYSHVLSFRRQVYVHPDDKVSLPSTTIIKHDETNYRIFFSYDELICFACKLPGHIAGNCPNQPNETQTTSDNHTIEEQTTNSNTLSEDNTAPAIIDDLMMDFTTTNIRSKRAAPSTISSTPESTVADGNNPFPNITETEKGTNVFLTPSTENITLKNQHKKLKKSDSTESLKRNDSTENLLSLSDMLSPLKEVIEEMTPPYILNYDQLYDFLENVHGSSDPLSVSSSYTKDTPALLFMLGKLYKKLRHRNIKSRFTRIRNRIKQQLKLPENTDQDTDSDLSQTSY